MDFKQEVVSVKTVSKSITCLIKKNTTWQSVIEKMQTGLEYKGQHEIVCGGLIQDRTALLSLYDFVYMPPVYLVPVSFSDDTYIYLSYKCIDFTVHPQTTFLQLKQAIFTKFGFQIEDIMLQLMDNVPADNQLIQQENREKSINDETFEQFLQISVKKRFGLPPRQTQADSSIFTYGITLKTVDNQTIPMSISIDKGNSTWGDLRNLVSEKSGIILSAQTSLLNGGRRKKDSDNLSKNSNHFETEIALSIPHKQANFILLAQNKVNTNTLLQHIRACSSSGITLFKMNAETFTPDPVLSGNLLGFYYDQDLPTYAAVFTSNFLNHLTPEILATSLCTKPIWGMLIPDTYHENRYQAMKDSLMPHTALGQILYKGGKTALLTVVENLPETTPEQKQFKCQVAECIVTDKCVQYQNNALYKAFQETRYGGSIKPNEGTFGKVNRLYKRLHDELFPVNQDFTLM